ncbi:MAG: histidine kinase [Segetibacter sp.]
MLTNPDIKPTNQLTADEKINDKYFRTVLILLFSMGAIGFVVRRNLSGGQMLVGCLYGIVSMVLMLEGNRYLWMLISTYLEWHKKPVKRIAAMLLSIFLYTTLLGILIYKGWQFLFGGGIINNDQLILIIAGMIFWVLIITHLYESAFLVKQSANDIIRKEQLERLSAEAELELLKSQIDPHFMFNSLNTLSHLITANPERAKIFNDALADVYRYILVNKGQKLVVLEEEINF